MKGVTCGAKPFSTFAKTNMDAVHCLNIRTQALNILHRMLYVDSHFVHQLFNLV